MHVTILEGGGPARTRDASQPRGAGRAGPACPPSVRACVTRKKGPKGPQNHSNSIRFFTKIEKLKILFNLHISASTECTRKHWFGTRFGLADAKKPFSSRSRKRRVRWSKMGSFFTFCEFLSRNASFFALKRLITLKYVLIFKK